jgi:hypothetical protein
MSNNTYNNAINGIPITILGTNIVSFASSINSSNIYGITANVVSNKINIINNNPGKFYINESDAVHTPLANVGITIGSYSNACVISGNVANPTIANNSQFSIGVNWNAILNSLPKASRKAFKCANIASVERKASGIGHRTLNNFANTHSPTASHPWSS